MALVGTVLDSWVFRVGRIEWSVAGCGLCHCGEDMEREKGKQQWRISIPSPWVLEGLSTQGRSIFEGLGEETEELRSVILESGEPCYSHTKAMSDLFPPRAMDLATDIQ